MWKNAIASIHLPSKSELSTFYLTQRFYKIATKFHMSCRDILHAEDTREFNRQILKGRTSKTG